MVQAEQNLFLRLGNKLDSVLINNCPDKESVNNEKIGFPF
jgi:hypothetical protein